tara:strand:- start:133 stop:549 length:417 start_codon:yes stop_codon:yes gene_type:complete
MAKQLHSAGFVIFKETLNSVAYLLLHNVKGHWDFPKGLIEEGEEPLAAAKREAKEEADLTHLEVIEGFHEKVSYDFKEGGEEFTKHVDYFLAECSDTVLLSDEHDEAVWVSYEEALSKLKFKEAKQVLEKAQNFLLQK